MFRFLPYGKVASRIATDESIIKPGMIFIDLYSKSIASIYAAYNNGANLIITEQNVNDMLLPLVKVKNIGKSYLKLLDLIYGNPIKKASFIPIYGGSQGNIVAKILESTFKKWSLKIKQNNELLNYSDFAIPLKYDFYVEDFFYYVLNCIAHNITIIPIPYDSNISSLEPIIQSNSECAIIVESSFINENSVCKGKPGKPVIINIDEPYALAMVNGKNENVIITYGLSKKAAVTATSIDYGEWTCFNYCLQRTLHTRKGDTLEPFETPLAIKGLGINKIYAALASVSCALYFDVDLDCIKESLMDYSDRGRDFLIKQYNKFTLVDNYCTDYVDYKETLEMIQFIDYEGLYVLISDKLICDEKSGKNLIVIIYELGINLNIKEIVLTSCSDTANIQKLNNFITQLEIVSKNLDFNIKYFNQLTYALGYIINEISQGDVLLTLGGNEMDMSTTITELILSN